MADFELAHKLTAGFEGGYSDHPNDNGNWTGGAMGVGKLIGTNLGIAAPVLKAYLKRMPTVQDMKSLKIETAKKIYKINYWDQIRGDEWNNQDNANIVYDMAVNSGVSRSIKLWQIAMGLKPTGKMNKETLDKTNQLT